jgi:voltage-gated potassium channel
LNFKKVIYNYLEAVPEDKGWEKAFNYFMVILILLNTLAVVIETVQSFDEKYYNYLLAFEVFSITVFSIEYVLRVWSITINEKYKNPVTGRIKFILTPLAINDLVSILPFFMFAFFPLDLRFLRLFRIFRFMRILKLGRYSHSLQILIIVLKKKKEQLVMAAIIVAFAIVISSCFIYIIEHEAQPDKYTSIPESIYWTVMTITSVGYGDIYPITPLGHFFAIFIALLGLGLFAIPIGILAAGFYEETNKKKCPHCGKELD